MEIGRPSNRRDLKPAGGKRTARRVLMTAYHFPPMGGSGVQRALKMCKYLPEYGWEATVLTAGHGHYPMRDESLRGEIANEELIIREAGWEPGGLAARVGEWIWGAGKGKAVREWWEARICWRAQTACNRWAPFEPEWLWGPSAIRRSERLVEEMGIETVVTSSPPLVCHAVGWWLKRRRGLRWVADLRDPVLDNFGLAGSGGMARWWARFVEGEVSRNADAIVVTCPELGERLVERHGANIADRIACIPNGFDESDGPWLGTKRNARMRIAYVGSAYGGQTLGPVIEAMREMGAQCTGREGRIDVRIVGSVSQAERARLGAIPPFVQFVGAVSHEAAIGEMKRADLLILVTPEVSGGEVCIPAKVFEYLAFGGHVLGIVHEGTALERLLRRAGNCTVLTSWSPEAIAEALRRGAARWETGRLQEARDGDVVSLFSRARQAGMMAAVLEGRGEMNRDLGLPAASGALEEAA